MEVIIKKRSQELESKRKENLSLVFEKRTLEIELNVANRKVQNLNKDIQTIHNELNTFAETFESKLEAAIIEKDAKLDEEHYRLEQVLYQLETTTAENQYLKLQLEDSKDLLVKLSGSLKRVSLELDALKKKALREFELKRSLQVSISSKLSQTKNQLMTELEREVGGIVAEITAKKENEFERIRKDNLHLTKELESLRQEMAAEDLLGLSEKLIKTRQENPQPKLFTQTTLMLDFPKLLEDLQVPDLS